MHHCPGMDIAFNEDGAIVYLPRFREYGIKILDGGDSFLEITYCPWCGARLPESLRDAWFAAIRGLELEPESVAMPPELQTDAWWKMQLESGQGMGE